MTELPLTNPDFRPLTSDLLTHPIPLHRHTVSLRAGGAKPRTCHEAISRSTLRPMSVVPMPRFVGQGSIPAETHLSLVERAVAGERYAFGELYEQHVDRVYR